MLGQRPAEARADLAIRLIERASFKVPQFANQIRHSQQPDEAKETRALQVLEHLIECIDEFAPDEDWYRDYYTLTGDHMVLTDEGWTRADMNTREYLGDDPAEVLDEVNAPA